MQKVKPEYRPETLKDLDLVNHLYATSKPGSADWIYAGQLLMRVEKEVEYAGRVAEFKTEEKRRKKVLPLKQRFAQERADIIELGKLSLLAVAALAVVAGLSWLGSHSELGCAAMDITCDFLRR